MCSIEEKAQSLQVPHQPEELPASPHAPTEIGDTDLQPSGDEHRDHHQQEPPTRELMSRTLVM